MAKLLYNPDLLTDEERATFAALSAKCTITESEEIELLSKEATDKYINNDYPAAKLGGKTI